MLTVIPHKGVDGLMFGMTRDEVAQAVAEMPLRGRRNNLDAVDYDFFLKLGLFVYYDVSGRSNAIEFTRDARVSYDGYELFAHPAHEVRAWARRRDPGMDMKDGFVSPALGLGMYAPILVPRAQHAPGSVWQPHLHPGGEGGMTIWGSRY